MDKDFARYSELAEMYGPEMMGLGLPSGHEDPDITSLSKKLDEINSAVNSLRDAMRKYISAKDDPQGGDEGLYGGITHKYVELICQLWASTKAQIMKMHGHKSEDEEPTMIKKTIVLAREPESEEY